MPGRAEPEPSRWAPVVLEELGVMPGSKKESGGQEKCRGVWWKMGLEPAVIPKAPGTIRGFEQGARHQVLCVSGRAVEEDGLKQGEALGRLLQWVTG